MTGRVLRPAFVTRRMVRENRARRVYMFGDNMAREGRGGQAAEMRGEPNTIGVPTKWRPDRHPSAYFTDDDWNYDGVRITIQAAFAAAEMFLEAGFDVVIPADGLGTGRARLGETAPVILSEINRLIDRLQKRGVDDAC